MLDEKLAFARERDAREEDGSEGKGRRARSDAFDDGAAWRGANAQGLPREVRTRAPRFEGGSERLVGNEDRVDRRGLACATKRKMEGGSKRSRHRADRRSDGTD